MIASYIQQIVQSAEAFQAWPVYVGDLPATVETCIALMELSGSPNLEYFSSSVSATVTCPVIKCIVRTPVYEAGRAACDNLKNLLNRYVDSNILSCLMVNSPMYLGRGDTKLHTFQISFQIRVKE